MADDGRTGAREVEVGWVVVAPAGSVTLEAVERARRAARERLQRTFESFTWRMPLVHLPRVDPGARGEPVLLLDLADREREDRHWDFVVIVTDTELKAQVGNFALATPSRALSAAALSTTRLDPAGYDADLADETRIDGLAAEVEWLMLGLFVYLAGCDRADWRAVDDDRRGMIARNLEQVADLRLEEEKRRPGGTAAFYVQALWLNAAVVAGAVRRAAPWYFPLRLSGLTTAAISALVVLLITAETWEVSFALAAPTTLALFLLTLGLTSIFVLARHGLLLRDATDRPSELRVVANISIALTVVLGMAVTYVMLFVFAWAVGELLFGDPLIGSWTGLQPVEVDTGDRLVMAGFVAAVGLVVGALGISLEGRLRFRHITQIDEEIRRLPRRTSEHRTDP